MRGCSYVEARMSGYYGPNAVENMKMALAIYERRQLLSSQARRMVEEQAVEIVQYTVQFPSGLVITAKTKEALEQKIFTYLNRKTPHVD